MSGASAGVSGEHVVLGDVGGTNVRFAVLTGGVLGPVEHMAVRDHTQFADALAAFLARQADRAAIRRAFFGVAGVVERALSGQGLEDLYRAIASIDALAVSERTAGEIVQAALEGACAGAA